MCIRLVEQVEGMDDKRASISYLIIISELLKAMIATPIDKKQYSQKEKEYSIRYSICCVPSSLYNNVC